MSECPCGGTGRRARLKIEFRKECWFDSGGEGMGKAPAVERGPGDDTVQRRDPDGAGARLARAVGPPGGRGGVEIHHHGHVCQSPRALPSWDSRTSGTIFTAALSSVRTAGPSGHANSSHPSAREGHLSTAEWISSFLLSGLILNGFHAAAVAGSLVHRNSVPSTHMRCMMTASRRARATIAFFIPRRLAICMAQALSQDHFFECNMLCAAS